jgi:Leucine-rich repeat (LRR) protein
MDGRFKDRLPDLKSIICYGLDTLSDLNAVPAGLEELKCNGCIHIKRLVPLAACTNLCNLNLSNTLVTDLNPLSACLRLDLYRTNVHDIFPLRKCVNLQWLMISKSSDEGPSNIKDISPLSSLTQMKFLNIQRTCISDLSPLSSLTSLDTLLCT